MSMMTAIILTLYVSIGFSLYSMAAARVYENRPEKAYRHSTIAMGVALVLILMALYGLLIGPSEAHAVSTTDGVVTVEETWDWPWESM